MLDLAWGHSYMGCQIIIDDTHEDESKGSIWHQKYEYRLMKLKWSDVTDIAILLEEKYPNEDNNESEFTDLHKWIVDLNEFDTPEASNERFLRPSKWHG